AHLFKSFGNLVHSVGISSQRIDRVTRRRKSCHPAEIAFGRGPGIDDSLVRGSDEGDKPAPGRHTIRSQREVPVMVKSPFVAVLVAGLAWSAAAEAEATKLKFAVFTPETEMTFVNIMKPFAANVAKASQGTVEFELFPNGALGRDPGKQMKMVQDGVADLAWIIPAYTPGVFPDDEVVELPGIIRDSKEGSIAIWRLWEKGLVRGYENLVPLAIFTADPYTVHTDYAVAKLDDLKGKKIRAAGPVASAAVTTAGAAPVGMPFTQIVESISRGVVDGTLAHPIALFDFGI